MMIDNISKFEEELLVKYLHSKNLDYHHFLKEFYDEIWVSKPKISENITIWEIIKSFETTIDKEFMKLNGAVYTPYPIIDYINTRVISENKNKKDIIVIDPACGCGAFLIDALFKLKYKTEKSYKEIVENNLFGIDIDPRAVNRSKILLSLVVYEKEGVIPKKFNIYNGNSLDKRFLKEILKGKKFDAVIGNPPYIRIQNLNDEMRQTIKDYWKLNEGDTDIFIPFIELGIELLNENGRMGYITPNSYFTTYAGRKLRKYLKEKRLIEEIVNFDHYQVFNKKTTYTAITIISKDKKEYFILKNVKSQEDLKNLYKIKKEKIYFKELSEDKWLLLEKKDREIIHNIENAYYKLKEIADIRVGIATLCDDVYIIDNPQEDNKYLVKHVGKKEYLIEKEITKEIIKASIIKSEKDIINNKRRIIFPYKKIGKKYVIIKEKEMKKEFPMAYDYLLDCKDILRKRDKGKREYEEWYAYGRSQGINTIFGKKILTPPMALKPTFVICEKEDALFYSGYGIFPKKPPFNDLYLLKKILNSNIMKLYIDYTAKSYQGGWKSYSKTFLKNFGIPLLKIEEIEFLKKENDQKVINDFLFKIYDKRGNLQRFL